MDEEGHVLVPEEDIYKFENEPKVLVNELT